MRILAPVLCMLLLLQTSGGFALALCFCDHAVEANADAVVLDAAPGHGCGCSHDSGKEAFVAFEVPPLEGDVCREDCRSCSIEEPGSMVQDFIFETERLQVAPAVGVLSVVCAKQILKGQCLIPFVSRAPQPAGPSRHALQGIWLL